MSLIAILIIPIILLLFLLAGFFYAIKPSSEDRDLSLFKKYYFAHRGLFKHRIRESLPSKNFKGLKIIPENSLPAFERAVENGYGIELDVCLTKDGQVVVFHDDNLLRMCGRDVSLSKLTLSDLKGHRLLNTGEKIPSLKESLELIAGRVPIIIEMKAGKKGPQLAERLAEILDGYSMEHGESFCVESFNSSALKWIYKNKPDYIRGQLATNSFKRKSGRTYKLFFFLNQIILNFRTRPHFLAYDHRYQDNILFRIFRKCFDATTIAWTVKTLDELDQAEKIFDIIIFEGFFPGLVKNKNKKTLGRP